MKNAHSCWMAPERLVRITDFSARQGLKEKNLLSLQAEARDRVSALNTSAALERFFTRAADLPERARKLSKGAPDLALQIRQTARKIRDHRIDLLASGPLFFGRPIAWHSDIRSGYRWDPTLDYQAAPDGLDRLIETGGGVELKAPWDLSNLHGLPTLTAAWGLDRDPAVLQAIEKDVTDWIEANPPFLGVNWYCAMNVAMRALSLLTTIAALYPDLNPEFLRAVLTSLYLHAVRIGAHLEHGRGGQRNNHYLSDLIGLYFLGTLFRDTPAGSEWLAFSIDELEIEAGLQFHPDGVCIEDSTSYHRFSTEILLLCAIQGEAAGRPFSTTFVDRLRKSLRFTLDILPSHHLIPQIGDNDNGRMLPLFGYQTLPGTDHRHILALGGEFFDDDSLRRAGADARGDALWFLGRWTEPAADRPPQPTGLFSYADSGFHGLRDDLILLLIHNNRIRPEHGGGHTHCDALSFTLTLQDRDLFVDAGVWNYSADIDGRNDFRSTAYH
ncbi:MAG: heparinase II/III family protein, partial [Kiritimatiellia bacterium]|nr:heparinase II/III family protein [Kiritimatiellia bacterium]